MRTVHDSGVDIEELRWFVTLAGTEHVTDAAALLHVSQPTLSRALGRIESGFGVPLFDRQGRRLRLNRYGRLVRDHAARALAELAAARDGIRALDDPDAGQVRLAFLHSFGPWLVPALLRGFRATAPGVRFVLSQDYHDAILAALHTGQADLALTSPRPTGAGTGWHGLGEEKLCLAVPPGHRFAGRARLRLAAAAGERFIMLSPTTELRRLTDDLCRRAGFSPRIAFESAELVTVRGLVAAGLGVAVSPLPVPPVPAPRVAATPPAPGGAPVAVTVPPHLLSTGPGPLVPEPGGPVYVPLTDRQARRGIGLAWLASREQSPAVERFRRYVAGVAA